jgi:L-lactate utilization protein LutC
MAAAEADTGLLAGVPGAPNERFRQVASRERLEMAAEALRRNGMTVYVEASGADALRRFVELVPEGSQVYTSTSRTTEAVGIAELVDKSGKYRSVRNQLAALDRKTQRREMTQLVAGAECIVGSVHAVTEQGQVVVASATGGQLGPYAASAARVVWVIGGQKLVRNLDEAFQRIREYSFPLEDERAKQAYGVGTLIAKVLILQRETTPGRISVIFVPAELGF